MMNEEDMGPVRFTWRFWEDGYLVQVVRTWSERQRCLRIDRLQISNEVEKWEIYGIYG